MAYQSLKDYKTAKIDLNEAIKIDEKYVDAYLARAQINKIFDDKNAATLDYTFVVKNDDKNFAAYFNRGLIYALQKNYQAAINDFTKVISLSPNDEKAYYNRALSKFKIKQDGCTDVKKSVQLGNLMAKTLLNQYCK